MLYWKLRVSMLQWYVCADEFIIGLCASRHRHHYQTWFMRDYIRYIVFYYECESVWSLVVTVIKKHLALLQHTSQYGSSLWSLEVFPSCSFDVREIPIAINETHSYVWEKNSLTFMYFTLIKYGTIKIRVEQNSLHPYVSYKVLFYRLILLHENLWKQNSLTLVLCTYCECMTRHVTFWRAECTSLISRDGPADMSEPAGLRVPGNVVEPL